LKTALLALSALLATLSLIACGSNSGDGSGGPTVSATTGIWADVAARVAGDDATVEQVIPEGVSPHEFQLSAEGRASIEDSRLLVYNGANLEQGIAVDDFDVPTFAFADNVGPLRPDDPHVWMDPTRVAAALPALAEALGEADPEHATGYRQRAAGFAAELAGLDREIAFALKPVPPQNRELVTSHDALGYFADHYGFEVVATPFPASGAEAEASASRIKEVEDVIREAGVPTVFAEHEDDPEVLELIADDTGVEIVEDLLVESPGDSGGYVEMLQRDADLIGNGLR
jgi:ABC-type Zn uptake system ZnuABC Zn-binding protein ZnuA